MLIRSSVALHLSYLRVSSSSGMLNLLAEVSALLLRITLSYDIRLLGSSSSSLVVAREHTLLGKSSRGPSSGPWSVSALPPEVSLGRVATAFPARGWPRASCDCFYHAELASGESKHRLPPRASSDESEQCLSSEVDLGRVGMASPA
jgi:hypothetical protein